MESYRDNENASQGSAGDDEDATAEQHDQREFPQWLNVRLEKHGQRDRQEIGVCDDVEGEVHPHDVSGDCGLANI